SIEHYGRTRAFFDSNGIVTGEEFIKFFKDIYGKIDYLHPKHVWQHSNSNVNVWRTYWYSGVQGTDYPLGGLYAFLRTGAGGRYMASLQKTLFNTDSAIIRSDGFNYSQSLIKSSYLYPICHNKAYNAGGGKNHFDYYGHNHWRAMPSFYYMTGNEEIKEAINDYLEEFVKKGLPMSNFNDNFGYGRSHARYYSTLALGYEFNKDEKVKKLLEDMTNVILDSRDDPPNVKPFGRNMERGYLWLHGSNPAVPVFSALHSIPIQMQDNWQAYRVLKEHNSAYPRAEELDDYLLGLAQFIYNEACLDEPNGDDFGYLCTFLLHSSNEWIPGGYSSSGNYIRKDDSSRAMLHAYYNTGDEKYLELGKKCLAFGGGTGSSAPFQANDLIYADLYGLNSYWSYLNDVAKVNNGGNNYTLTWTVPEGASDLKIKYSNKPIVDWLGFDQMTREYEYSPDDYIAFFAATNIDNEPALLAAGVEQSVTIDIEEAINSYNTVRNLTPDNPSYVTYDPNKTYYFAMKYEHSPESGDTPPDDGGDTPPDDGGDTPPDDGDVEDDEIRGDLDGDGDIDRNDLNILLGYRDQPASACIACDLDGDGTITVLDARKLVITCTRPRCSGE
ncbi:MAG: hypothetical protein U9R21_07035, partial [Candidatus Thermoplasmatota archaeon]|nr:hypothetical protein [Candidatus Thermoplasmatota archaeon]